jgi:hypothetical protein
MNLLGAALYDPAVAVSKATSSLLAMTALDTTNLRLTVTVPAHGMLRVRMRCVVTGATTYPQILLGVMVGAAVKGRAAPALNSGGALATSLGGAEVDFTITGLAAGSTVFDAAYAVQVVVASTNIKYGGPDTNGGANAWGAFIFELWDPQPLPTVVAGGSGGLLISGTNTGTTTLGALTVTGTTTLTGAVAANGGVTFTSSAGSGFTCSSSGGNGSGIMSTGNGSGAGINGQGGSSGSGFAVLGGTGGSLTFGFTGQGFNGGDGMNFTGGGAGAGMGLQGGATGTGLKCIGGATSGHGIFAQAAAGGSDGIRAIGSLAGQAMLLVGGATGPALNLIGGGTSGAGIVITTTSGDGILITPTAGHGILATANGTSKHGIVATGGTAGTSDGIKAVAGTGGVPIRGDLTGNITGTVSGSVGDLLKINGSAVAAQLLALMYGAFENGTAQAGGASTITLRAGAGAADDLYKDEVVFITGGTGAGQTNRVTGYVGSTKVATVETAWVTQPDATSTYVVLGRVG